MLRPLLRWLSLVALAVPAGTALWVMLARAAWPYELEWMEGAMADLVARVQQGASLYIEPSLAFVPFIYPPLYFWLGAGLWTITGPGLPPLRCISIAAALGTTALLAWCARRETGSRFWAVVAACLFLGSFGATGFWMDLARVDAVALFLTAAGFVALRRSTPRGSGWLGGILLGAAFHAKQTAALAALPMLALGWISLAADVWLKLVVGWTAMVGLPALWGHLATQGWYTTFVLILPRLHPFEPIPPVDFLLDDLAPWVIALMVGSSFFWYRPPNATPNNRSFHALMLVGLVGSAWLAYQHEGSYRNVLLPAAASIALLAALGGSALERLLQETTHPSDRPSRNAEGSPPPVHHPPWATTLEMALCIALIVQAWRLGFSPGPLIPDAVDRAEAARFVEFLRQRPGSVLLPYHGWYLTLAGKPAGAHHMALCDVLRVARPDLRDGLLADFRATLAGHRYDTIIVDEPWFPEVTEPSYRLEGEWAIPDERAFYPRVGMPVRPRLILVPRRR
ncbi:MAG: Glycosyl transferase, family 2 [Candidatus Ozemobacter sibiricus]|jgi:hypothetical protein|uniref:Glycosyl transferase, family 2 n=1 Tax=Candidatus Ozemobacter sibiricus TaxID=2268124 RepID=A0A367ZRP0_9BACT|nr:MAG: Glycosyl transferase, family 2 [Candidatus Ozemobacter sibiricus]